ncbi:Protein F53A3.1 [Aphelenchoides avenae]|nr:Protein F53A3.1 [Aphelenchus avenae]
MAELITWCTTRLAILKWMQMLCSMLAVLFLIDGRIQWWVYTLIFISAIVLAIITFVTLILYFLRFHIQQGKGLPWQQLELLFNVVACVLCFIYTGALVYDYAKMSGGQFGHHRFSPPANIGQEGWKNRVLVVAVSQFLNGIFYLFSAYRTQRYGIV